MGHGEDCKNLHRSGNGTTSRSFVDPREPEVVNRRPEGRFDAPQHGASQSRARACCKILRTITLPQKGWISHTLCLGHRWRAPIPKGKLGEKPRIGGGPDAGAATEDPEGLGATPSLRTGAVSPGKPRGLSHSGGGRRLPGREQSLRATKYTAAGEQQGSGSWGLARGFSCSAVVALHLPILPPKELWRPGGARS